MKSYCSAQLKQGTCLTIFSKLTQKTGQTLLDSVKQNLHFTEKQKTVKFPLLIIKVSRSA